ncbi:MAG: DUF3396 domain-containing protein [Labilithrix sp.]|nr:DUF3396 domain-containing protein [Labilithrix sp.]MCW5811205.1 DUF3396 domain-containing protein [Labilithrix sp.]
MGKLAPTHAGRVYADERLLVSLFFEAPHAEVAGGVLAVLDRMLERAGMTWIGGKRIKAEGAGTALYAPFSEALAKRVRGRLERPDAHPDEWFVVRDEADESTLPRHRLRYDARTGSSPQATGRLELWLPPEPFSSGDEQASTWLVDLLARVAFTSGTVSIGLVSEGVPDPVGFNRAVVERTSAHPGLDLVDPTVGARLGTCHRGIGWLTLLSPAVLARLGVARGDELELPRGVSWLPFDGGRGAVRAGKTPSLDDDPKMRALALALWPAQHVHQGCPIGLYEADGILWQLRWLLPPRPRR